MTEFTACKSRRKPDLELPVADICAAFRNWFKKRGSRDMNGMLSEIADCSWKTAPQVFSKASCVLTKRTPRERARGSMRENMRWQISRQRNQPT